MFVKIHRHQRSSQEGRRRWENRDEQANCSEKQETTNTTPVWEGEGDHMYVYIYTVCVPYCAFSHTVTISSTAGCFILLHLEDAKKQRCTNFLFFFLLADVWFLQQNEDLCLFGWNTLIYWWAALWPVLHVYVCVFFFLSLHYNDARSVTAEPIRSSVKTLQTQTATASVFYQSVLSCSVEVSCHERTKSTFRG